MTNEGSEWIMKGLDWDNPYRILSWRELTLDHRKSRTTSIYT